MHCGAKQQSNLNNALWSKSKNALWSKATIKSQQCTVEQSKGATEEQNKNSLWSKVTIKSNNVEQSMRAQSSKRGDAFKSGECSGKRFYIQFAGTFLQSNLNNALCSITIKSNTALWHKSCADQQKWKTWRQRRECTSGNRF